MNCDKCGLCCQYFNKLDLPEEYKKLDRGDGVCIYLKDKLCSIYDSRPLLCNSEKMYSVYYHSIFETYEEYEDFLQSECTRIKRESRK